MDAAAGAQGAAQRLHKAWIKKPMIVMPLLGPGVGEKDVVRLNGRRGHQKRDRIISLNAQQAHIRIAEAADPVVNFPDAPQHAINAEQIGFGMGARPLHQKTSLTAAQVHLDGTVIAKVLRQGQGIDPLPGPDADAVQEGAHKRTIIDAKPET